MVTVGSTVLHVKSGQGKIETNIEKYYRHAMESYLKNRGRLE
jgi:hypothetical protein